MLTKLTGVILVTALLCSSPVYADGGAKSLGGISFTVPAGWKETPPSSSMRAFQFEIPGANVPGHPGESLTLSSGTPRTDQAAGQKAEMAVFYFGPGMGGGIQANVARWKGQFKTLTAEEVEERQQGAVKVTIVSLKGTFQPSGGPMMTAEGAAIENSAVLAAIAEGTQGSIFFKLTGPGVVLAEARPGFDSLVASLK